MPEKPPYRERRCGNCCYGQRIPNNISKIICHGRPPQLFIMGGGQVPGLRGPQTQVNFEAFSPMLDGIRPACSLWEKADADTVEVRESEAKN